MFDFGADPETVDEVWEYVFRGIQSHIADSVAHRSSVVLAVFKDTARIALREISAQTGLEMPEKQYELMDAAVTLCYGAYDPRVASDVRELLGIIGVVMIDGGTDEETPPTNEVLTKEEKNRMLEEILRRLRSKKSPPYS